MLKLNHMQYMLLLIMLVNIGQGYEHRFSSCNDFKLLNGRMRLKTKGRLAKFQCNRGYMLAGEKYGYCIKGKFDISPPVCVKPTCTKIKQFSNGLILPSYNGGVVNFYCKPGFTMRGSNISYCDGTRWSDSLPACISTHTPTPTSCDFETEDLCGWSHDLNHDFDWRRQNFQTPSGHIGTGPKHDHTMGPNKDGYYIYIESTSRLESDTARLISPLYPPYPTGVCFTFWYHMYGKDIGQLRIYIRRENQNQWGIIRGMNPLWTEQGNQGDKWHMGRVIVDEGINENFQIIVEGVRGKSYVSDIAVDDVLLSESCPDDEEIFSSSTTDSSTDYEADVNFGSCVNRCDDNNTEIILSDSGSCECNESCHEKNTCCPDYTFVCLIAALDEFSTDFTDIYWTTDELQQYTTPLTNTPIDVTDSIRESYRTSREVQSTTQPTTTVEPTTSTTQPTTTVEPTTSTTTEKTNKTKKPLPTFTTPTTTNRSKVTSPKPTTKNDKNINNIDKIYTTTSKTIKNITNITNTSVIPKKESTATSNSVKLVTSTESIVATKSEIETTTFKMQTLEIETDYEGTNAAVVPTAEPKVDMVRHNDKIIKENGSAGNSNQTFVIFGASAIVLIGIVVAAVIFTKYSTKCSRLKFRNSRNTDSMSDVRFLASDEVLDFTWRSSSDL